MASSKSYVPLAHSEMIQAPGARTAGRANLNEVAEVTLFVRAAETAPDLSEYAASLGKVRASERQYLSRQELSDTYGADASDLAKIGQFANKYGLTVAAINPGQRSLRLAGKLSDLATAFNVQFSIYQSSHGSYRGYAGTVHVPDEISGIVEGVFGLDNKPQAQSRLQLRKQHARAAAPHTGKLQSYSPNQVASLYNFPTDGTGQGQCIGIIEFGGGYQTSDLNAYFQSLGIQMPDIVSISVAGATNNPTPGQNSPDFEVMLDVEVVGAIAPGAQIVVYFAPNTTLGWWRAINTAIHDTFHNPSVISISWGGPELSWTRAAMHAMNYAFQVAGSLGITICTEAGDEGYTDGVPGHSANVDFPASSPYVLACGGTHLESAGGKVTAESVWNDSPSSATGGGISAVFALPSYQDNAGVPPSVNPQVDTGRGVPDVAGDADPNTGYNIRVHGQDTVIGGTSAVAPLWAALLILINEKLGTPLGFVNPLLYGQGEADDGFNDIVDGNNGVGGYKAGPGWDACSGLGSPDGTQLSEVL